MLQNIIAGMLVYLSMEDFCGNHRVFRGNRGGVSRRQQCVRGRGENKNDIDLAKPKIGARICFSRTSQGHNALPRPGLELGSSDSELSALTTGLLNKAHSTVDKRKE